MHKIVIAVTGQQQSELDRIATTLQTTPEILAYLIIQEWMGSAHGDPAEEFQIMSLREYEHRQGEITDWRKEDWI